MQKQPTRNENNLDLFLTNNELLVKSTSIIPGISDHEIVVINSIIRPIIAKAAERKIYKWYSVDWIEINENLSQCDDVDNRRRQETVQVTLYQ